jgi:hypothetical protein
MWEGLTKNEEKKQIKISSPSAKEGTRGRVRSPSVGVLYRRQ